MRISDWSSDVCSSDLPCLVGIEEVKTGFSGFCCDQIRLPVDGSPEICQQALLGPVIPGRIELTARIEAPGRVMRHFRRIGSRPGKLGRASCRERGCQYV